MKQLIKPKSILVAAILFLVSIGAQAAVKVNSWSPLYNGVDQTTASIDGKHASVAYAVRIDLQASGVSFLVSPHSGAKESISDTPQQFAVKNHLQLAINASFFDPCCSVDPVDEDIIGLAISEGKVVSPLSINGQYSEALMISKDNQAAIGLVTAQTDLSNIYTAVSGSAIIVKNGVNSGDENDLNKAAYGNPRTVVGLSRDGRYLYLVVVDGRKPGYSFGTTNTESAAILLALGAYNALNLDGGGSTTMVRQNDKGQILTVNKPSGGAERLVACSLGVRALSLSH
jgi:exopolysaccharide biosynthesis protein